MTIAGSEQQDSSQKQSLSPSTSAIPVRKRTPTGSKTWKEKLRLACIDRARRRRRHDHDHDHPNDGNGQDYNDSDNDRQRPSGGEEIDGDSSMMSIGMQLPPARAILDAELRQQGITIMSPCIHMNSRNEHQQQMNAYSSSSPSRGASTSLYSQVDSPSAAAAATFTANNDSGINDDTSGTNDYGDDNDNNIHANHYISEEELFELLQEVEEEMQRSEEEMYQLLAREREYELEQQVQDFEQQQEQEQEAASTDVSLWNFTAAPVAVLCPICKEANLSETMQGGILCPNHMDGSCPFELRAGNGHGLALALTLENLCQQLRYAYEQHALYCHDYLSFEVSTTTATNNVNDRMIHTEQQHQHYQGQAENTSLVAVCPACETRMQLV